MPVFIWSETVVSLLFSLFQSPSQIKIRFNKKKNPKKSCCWNNGIFVILAQWMVDGRGTAGQKWPTGDDRLQLGQRWDDRGGGPWRRSGGRSRWRRRWRWWRAAVRSAARACATRRSASAMTRSRKSGARVAKCLRNRRYPPTNC